MRQFLIINLSISSVSLEKPDKHPPVQMPFAPDYLLLSGRRTLKVPLGLVSANPKVNWELWA